MREKQVSSKNYGTEARIREYLVQHPDASMREIGKFVGVSRQWVYVLVKRMQARTPGLKRNKVKLTAHQLDIIRYIAKGYRNRQIAEVFGCSVQAISNQLHAIYVKLDVHKRKHAVRAAIKLGIIPPND